MKERETIIKNYFESWIRKDNNKLKYIFTDEIIYIESHGPVYKGINDVEKWFKEWNKIGIVLKWDIKQFVHQKNITVVEWFFKCSYNKVISSFDGVSIIKFDKYDLINYLKEFQSKNQHYFPYEY
ncbi:MAG: nuclear transport factor 2 family protein [Clostridiales bacterium]